MMASFLLVQPPPDAFTTKDVVTIAVSSTSAAIALIGALWQFTLYKLSGSRVFVEIRPAMVDLYGTNAIGPPSGITKKAMEPFMGAFPKSVLYVRAVNIGRTATSIEELSIDAHSRRNRWKKATFRRHRSTYRGTPVPISGSTTERVFRLEPGQSASVYFDQVGLFENLFVNDTRKLVLRAAATPSGRRTRRSRWTRRLVVRDGQDLYADYEGHDRDAIVYRRFWQGLINAGASLATIRDVWFETKNALDSGASKQAVIDIICPQGDHFGKLQTAIEVFDLYWATTRE